MEKVIATIVIIVLTLGLISYAIIGQIGGFKDASDSVTTEQAKLNAVLNESDVISGQGAKNYVRQGVIIGYEVYLGSQSNDNLVTTSNLDTKLDEGGLYKVTKFYESAGSTSIDYIVVTPWPAAA
ncbi:MAG: hypothetical protein II748_03200 [Clostridia bacterium]|jgi:hypothetical protein|nr:hypothetical protein [Clostridia bacterium]